MPDPNYLSEIEREDGTVLTIRDAEAHAEIAAQLQQIETNKTNIGKVQSQANWNTNNGVKNFATENNFSHTGYYKDILVDGSLTGNVVVYIGNIISTDTDANQCAVLFIYTDNTSSPIHLVNRGTSSSFSANLETSVLKSIRIYPSDNYVHSPGDTVTVTDLMVCPKSLYDADSTYVPCALPNTKITPELIELVDSGAKNVLDLDLATIKSLNNTSGYSWNNNAVTNAGVTYTINSDMSITLTGTASGLSYIRLNSNFTIPKGTLVLSGCPTGGASNTYRLYADGVGGWEDVGQSAEKTFASDVTATYLTLAVNSGTATGITFKPMICSKAAWDVSQKFVPHRQTYEETIGILSQTYNSADCNMSMYLCQDNGSIDESTYYMTDQSKMHFETHCFRRLMRYWKDGVDYQKYRWLSTGVIATNNSAKKDMLTLDIPEVTNETYVKIYHITDDDGEDPDQRYSWQKTNVNIGDVWYIRPHVEYTDLETGMEYTMYGPVYKVTVGVPCTIECETLSCTELTTTVQQKIGASDYATQNTGGTVRVWTTTDGTDTILHIANEAPTP